MLRQVPSITRLLFDWFFSFYFRARVSLGSLGWPCTHILLSSLWGQRLQACTPKPASDCSSDFWVLTWLRLTSALFQFQSGHRIRTKMPQVQVCLFFFFSIISDIHCQSVVKLLFILTTWSLLGGCSQVGSSKSTSQYTVTMFFIFFAY